MSIHSSAGRSLQRERRGHGFSYSHIALFLLEFVFDLQDLEFKKKFQQQQQQQQALFT